MYARGLTYTIDFLANFNFVSDDLLLAATSTSTPLTRFHHHSYAAPWDLLMWAVVQNVKNASEHRQEVKIRDTSGKL